MFSVAEHGVQPWAKRTMGSPWPTAWPRCDADFGNHARTRCADEVVHLHRVQHRDLLAARDGVAHLDVQFQDHAGHGRVQGVAAGSGARAVRAG
jgi:hypothetical protein